MSSPADDEKVVTIPESNHSIRIQDLDKEALKVLYRLRDEGFSGYLVGGGVRDLYMGKQPKDFDISTNAKPGQLRKIFRNSRTIGRRFRLVQVYFRGGKIVEVSTLRSQSEYDLESPEAVLASNNTFGTLPEDAKRRDLTINSLFYEIENRTIIDYVGGVRDLDAGIIRIVGEPDRRITRDPVRMLRAVRHAARAGFTIEPITWKAIVANREKLNVCPPSRIRDELLKDLRSGAAEPWAEITIKCGIFFTLFPWYTELLFEQGESDHHRLLMGLLRVIDRLYTASTEEYQVEIPDYLLLTMLVLPWINARFDLMRQRMKGPAYTRFSREIRGELDQLFSERLNLKRMARESMTTMLVNLPAFSQFAGQQDWPKWLRRKSYFQDCLRLYSLYAEAMGQGPADEQAFMVKRSDAPAPVYAEKNPQSSGSGSGKGRRGVRPAFTNRKKGVFGLRNR